MMKNKMEDIDSMIKESLTQDEAKFYDSLEEQNPLEMLGGLFRGKYSWFIIVINVVTLAAFVAFIYCLVQFLNVDSTEELIKWGAGGFIALMMISMLKLFMWLQMDKNALMRELKRLELQVSSLAGKISG